MAIRSKPPIWRTIRAGYASAAEQFRALGPATVIAVVLVAILQLIRVPTQEPVLAIVRPVLVSLASAIVLSPYAVLVHRRILLGIDDRSYWTTFSAPRTLAFTSAAIGLGLLSEAGLMALLVGIRPPDPRVVLILLGMAWITVALGFFCRAGLVFRSSPSTDRRLPGGTASGSRRATRGASSGSSCSRCCRFFWPCWS